jgi:hypothetical protein
MPEHIANANIPLNVLPPDAELIGPEPTPGLMQSLRDFGGVLVPLLLIAEGQLQGPTGYIVVDGTRRVKGMRRWQREWAEEAERIEAKHGQVDVDAGEVADFRASRPPQTVPARIFPPGWSRAEVLSVVANEERSENLPRTLDNLRRLLQAGVDPEEVRRSCGLDKTQYKQVAQLLALNAVLLQALIDGKLPAGRAREIARMPVARQDKLAAMYEAEGKLSAEDVREVRSVGSAAAAALIPDDVFNTPGADASAPAWGAMGFTPGAVLTAQGMATIVAVPAGQEPSIPYVYREVDTEHWLAKVNRLIAEALDATPADAPHAHQLIASLARSAEEADFLLTLYAHGEPSGPTPHEQLMSELAAAEAEDLRRQSEQEPERKKKPKKERRALSSETYDNIPADSPFSTSADPTTLPTEVAEQVGVEDLQVDDFASLAKGVQSERVAPAEPVWRRKKPAEAAGVAPEMTQGASE